MPSLLLPLLVFLLSLPAQAEELTLASFNIRIFSNGSRIYRPEYPTVPT